MLVICSTYSQFKYVFLVRVDRHLDLIQTEQYVRKIAGNKIINMNSLHTIFSTIRRHLLTLHPSFYTAPCCTSSQA